MGIKVQETMTITLTFWKLCHYHLCANFKWLNLIINQIHNDPLQVCGKQAVKDMLLGGSSATFTVYDRVDLTNKYRNLF